MRKSLLVAIAVVMSGCQAPTAPQATGAKAAAVTRRASTTATAPSTSATTATGAPAAASAVTGPTRTIDPAKLGADALASVSLVGKVKLVSDRGAGIISNNSGGLISNNGGGLISDRGGGLVSNNGGGVVAAGGGSYRLLAETSLPEALLAEARIDVLDGEGKQLVGPDGTPIGGVTDSEGHYQLTAQLPKENFVLRVRLFPSQDTGSELLALLPNKAGERTVDIDTASSLGASYVLDKYVQKRQDVYNKLPASEAEALQRDMGTARAKLTKVPSYKPTEQTALVEELRTQTPALNDTLERIKALLLAGQKDLGNGLAAVKVSLTLPFSVAQDPEGNLYITEGFFGRIRKVGIDGTIGVYPKPDTRGFGVVDGSVRGPDGSFYIPASRKHQVWRVKPDGTTVLVAGTGVEGGGAVEGKKATEVPITTPEAVALGPDGSIYIGEASTKVPNRLLKVDTDGTIHEVPYIEADKAGVRFGGLAVLPDGRVVVMDNVLHRVTRQKAGGGWEVVSDGLKYFARARVAVGPDGSIYASESGENLIWRFKPDGTKVRLAGKGGAPGYAGDGGPATAAALSDPAGMLVAADGTFYFCDSGNAVVRAIGKDGVIRTVAGIQGMSQVGDAQAIALNGPTGVAIDPQGRLVVAEGGASLVKRLENNSLTVIAGSTRGYNGDGGPALTAGFSSPMGIAYAGQVLYVLDTGNNVLRRIAADGTVSTVAGLQGGRQTGTLPARIMPPGTRSMRLASCITTDAQGRAVWCDTDLNTVMRLNADGQTEVIAGALDGAPGYSGDGGPAASAKLNHPAGVLGDAAGNVYVSDAGNMVIRKIAADGTISTIAGTGGQAGMMKVMTGAVDADGADAVGATLIGPAGMCLDAAGNLYVAEFGTGNMDALGMTDALPAGVTLPVTYPKIRKITPAGKIYTVAGPGTKLLADTTGDNRIGTPAGLAIDGEGRLIVSDGGFNQLKLLPKGSF